MLIPLLISGLNDLAECALAEELGHLVSVCQVSVWYDNIVSIIVVDLAVLGV
jgi:hypothetical protein